VADTGMRNRRGKRRYAQAASERDGGRERTSGERKMVRRDPGAYNQNDSRRRGVAERQIRDAARGINEVCAATKRQNA